MTEEIDLDVDILERNREEAKKVNDLLKKNQVRSYNVVGAIGSGKTSIIEWFIKESGDVVPGAILGDVSGKDDYNRISSLGVPAVNINTGKECHLDAHIVKHGMEKMPVSNLDYLFFENVGNLVCPADFPLGADARIVVVSVSEGDDVINKHPVIFKNSDIVVINKIDISEAVGSNIEKMIGDAKELNPKLKIFTTSTKTGENMEKLINHLKS